MALSDDHSRGNSLLDQTPAACIRDIRLASDPPAPDLHKPQTRRFTPHRTRAVVRHANGSEPNGGRRSCTSFQRMVRDSHCLSETDTTNDAIERASEAIAIQSAQRSLRCSSRIPARTDARSGMFTQFGSAPAFGVKR